MPDVDEKVQVDCPHCKAAFRAPQRGIGKTLPSAQSHTAFADIRSWPTPRIEQEYAASPSAAMLTGSAFSVSSASSLVASGEFYKSMFGDPMSLVFAGIALFTAFRTGTAAD